jgi:uncharacterized protein
MRKFLPALLLGAATLSAWALDPVPKTRLDADLRCQLGVYTLPSGETLTLTGDNAQPRALQLTRSSGVFASLKESGPGQFEGASLQVRLRACDAGMLELNGERATRLPLVEKGTRFRSEGIELHGKLVLPVGGKAEALAVWIEGSNNNPSTDDAVWPYELARRGVAVFVHDKRGTGASQGEPSSDFQRRAQDAVAALAAAQQLAPGVRRVGVIGASQGGWVAPLVAQRTPLDFVVTAYALAESPIAQDQAIVQQQLREAGFGDEPAARELTALTERIVRTMHDGFEELDAFKAKHAAAPWLKAIQPRSYTGLFLQVPSSVLKEHGAAMAQGLPFAFDPQPVIASIPTRQLWLLAGSDRQAPNAGTQAFLRKQQARGRDIAVRVFPHADHGLIEPGPRFSTAAFEAAATWMQSARMPAAN